MRWNEGRKSHSLSLVSIPGDPASPGRSTSRSGSLGLKARPDPLSVTEGRQMEGKNDGQMDGGRNNIPQSGTQPTAHDKTRVFPQTTLSYKEIDGVAVVEHLGTHFLDPITQNYKEFTCIDVQASVQGQRWHVPLGKVIA
ncbi:hypothetical protein ElyMa_002091000 [Elysia marginata]|uniref:Uncharacterized protein n=1 Tax=Elysia marginata TaxID=1093978 RepID=A0AAV4FEK8_9GAST|nr:hypothetical protein ElyMa_002091000 [Elysia marginata]